MNWESINDQEYLWPTTVSRPRERVVYLDLNHWISLAKANCGHPDGARFSTVLMRCQKAVESGTAVFPLSFVHYAETQKIKDPAQRLDLAVVMESLSGFRTLLPGDLIRHLEIEAILEATVGPSSKPAATLPLVGQSVFWAFGRVGGLRVRDRSGQDQTDQARRGFSGGPEAFNTRLREVEVMFDRRALAGPQNDEEVKALRRFGWAPEQVVEMFERAAEEERAQARRLDEDPKWRRGRLRDVISARELLSELNGMLTESLAARRLHFDDLGWNRQDLRRFMAAMPSTDVAVTLKTAAHRNQSKAWATNDIHDIRALSTAVPYCDIVVTEKHAHSVLTAAKVPAKTRRVLLRRLDELQAVL